MHPNDRNRLEAKTRLAAETQACAPSPAGLGCDGGYEQAKVDYRPSIRERVDQAMQDAYRANERANTAAEIGFLLDKNPDLGRLLDLLERF